MHLAAAERTHNPEALSKDMETLVDEVFRVCPGHQLTLLFNEYPGPSTFSTWFFVPEENLTSSTLRKLFQSKVPKSISPPTLGKEPALYHFEDTPVGSVFRFAAKDGAQNIQTDFDESERIEFVNYYTVIVHFSLPTFSVFGPYAKVETKRHDPSGNYKTITLQSRAKYPDLETVPDFRKSYLDADSMYDVLEFTCTNALGVSETVDVRFGYPFGRFSFRAATSLSAITYFEQKIRALL